MTDHARRATISPSVKSEYVIKVSWRGTALRVVEEASSAEAALHQAVKRKDTVGHLDMEIVEVRPVKEIIKDVTA